MLRRILGGATAALFVLALGAAPALAGHAGAKPGTSTIVGIVLANDGEFDVLQAAVVEAGLVDALNGTDQYTVFAPTDAAFVSTFRSLLNDSSITEADVTSFINAGGVDTAFGDGALADILLFHVTNGRRTSTSVLAAPRYQMLDGKTLTRGDLVSAGIAAVDISASNGVIHVINHVLLP
ncbi:MAG TPA: fasciclin domain-containing protein [Candidatus Limnocylindrales bacterium]